MRIHWKQNLIVKISLFLSLVSLIIAISLTVWYVNDKSQIENTAKNIARETASNAATEIEETLSEIPSIAHAIADDLTSGKLTDEDVEDRLLSELEMRPRIGAITACYVPEFVPDCISQADRCLYCPFSYRQPDGEIVIERIEDAYDYTKPPGTPGPDGVPITSDWYHRPFREGPSWGEPYFGSFLQDYWAGYGTPFYRTDPNTGQRAPAGIIDVSLTLDQFQELIGTIDLKSPGVGYGFILSKTGTFIAHPIREFVTGQINISDISDSLTEESLRDFAEYWQSEQTIIEDHVDERSGQSSWLFLSLIPETDWWVGIVLDKALVIRSNLLAGQTHQIQIAIAMAVLAFLFFLSVFLLRVHEGINKRLWAVSATFSILCILGTGYIWFLAISGSSGEDARDIMLIDRASSEKVEADWGRNAIDPVYVPTGVLIQSMDFTTAHDILITGYIWQKYSGNIPDWAKPKPDSGEVGFILPQEIGWKMTSEAYRQKTYKVTYTISNQGFSTAAPCTPVVLIDGEEAASDEIKKCPALAAGDSYTQTVGPFTLTGNSDEIKVCADRDDAIFEADEENNCRQVTWTGGGAAQPDLVVTSISQDLVVTSISIERDQEVIGWNVRATIRQEIDYTQYPFHREDVEIPIWHKNFDSNVILTPDLVSYATTAPESLSYVGQDFFLEGWNTDRTFFSYRERSYNTDFGLNSDLRQQKIPELYLHLSLTRQFVDAFISHIIPIAVVICLLFAVLVVVTRREEKIKIIGVTASTVLAYCAALFFTVVLLHINLRTGLEAPARIVYIEYLYFLIYAAILGVSVNAILFTSRVKIWLVEFRDNLLIELLFWPVFTALLLVISLFVFI